MQLLVNYLEMGGQIGCSGNSGAFGDMRFEGGVEAKVREEGGLLGGGVHKVIKSKLS